MCVCVYVCVYVCICVCKCVSFPGSPVGAHQGGAKAATGAHKSNGAVHKVSGEAVGVPAEKMHVCVCVGMCVVCMCVCVYVCSVYVCSVYVCIIVFVCMRVYVCIALRVGLTRTTRPRCQTAHQQ